MTSRSRSLPSSCLISCLLLSCCSHLVRATLEGNRSIDNPKYLKAEGKVHVNTYIAEFEEDQFSATLNTAASVSAEAQAIIQSAEVEIRCEFFSVVKGFVFAIKDDVSDESREEILNRVLASSMIKHVEEDQEVELQAEELCPHSWGLDRVDQKGLPLDGVYHYDWTGANVDVYVLDAGIRDTHDQFRGANGASRVRCGPSYVFFENSCNDRNGHGTHVAGTVAGRDVGVAKEATVWDVKVMNDGGGGNVADIICGLEWSIRQAQSNPDRRHILNMSIGARGRCDTMRDMIRYAYTANILTVTSAGNSEANACDFTPAGIDTAVTVGSTDINDRRSRFSNFGMCVDIFAPGRDILSADSLSNTAMRSLSGTSMAAPHVAGVAAVYWHENPSMTVSELRLRLAATSDLNVVDDARTPWGNRISTTTDSFVTGVGTNPDAARCPYPYHGSGSTAATAWSMARRMWGSLLVAATFWGLWEFV